MRRPTPGGGPFSGAVRPSCVSRAVVLAGAGAAGAAQDPRPPSGTGPILDVLTSWDGAWYFEVARHGYPHHIPPNITFNQLEARAAFFPLYPRMVWALDKVLPGGDVLAGLGLNIVLGAVFVLLVGVMARRLFGNKVASRAMVLTALFPGSFVLSFALQRGPDAGAGRRLPPAPHGPPMAPGRHPGRSRHGQPAQRHRHHRGLRSGRHRRHRRAPGVEGAPRPSPGARRLARASSCSSRHQTGERKAWFRVQGEAWHEGTSFGLTAIKDVGNAFVHPMDSPKNILTLLCVAAMLVGHLGGVEAAAPAPRHRLHGRDPRADARAPDGHRSSPLPVHRLPAPHRHRRGLARAATTRPGHCCWPPAARGWPPSPRSTACSAPSPEQP